ncbi:MAG: enoyl-CoA hydratase/isomerase family protein, partial [Maritimibacter sp.]|nr:enoyl-CoA hydratase/isomerase family protein [Maritimibacter sp.]
EAERAGLVARVVPAKKLLEEATAAAKRIAEKSAMSIMAIKEAVRRADEMPLNEAILHERRLFQALFATEDQKEGMNAFIEKREPQFRDR